MKKIKAYALVKENGALIIIDGRLPIYWKKKIAQEEAAKFHAIVVGIIIPNEERSEG